MSEALERARAVEVIKKAGSGAGRELAAALARFAPSVLVGIATSSEPWHVRRPAIFALSGRVDDAVAASLLAMALDARETGELRCDAIDVLARAGRTEIVGPLRRLRAELAETERPPHGLAETAVAAAARLGDVDAAVGALRLRYDAWRHLRHQGEEAVLALQDRVGLGALARAFGAHDASVEGLGGLALRYPEKVVRRWAVDVAPPDAPWLVAALRDPEWVVAEGVHAALLRSTSAVEPALTALASDPEAEPEVRARAILALLGRGQREEAQALWDAFGDGDDPMPGFSPVIRRAVLYSYLPGERGTDPRWLLEGVLDHGFDLGDDRHGGPDEPPEAILQAARDALGRADFPAGKATPIGQVREQGWGTYVHLEVKGGVLEVSELGRFVATELALPAHVRAALEQAGFLFIEPPLAGTIFEGLCVYFFGRRDPLSVYDLLFYWQD